MAALLPSPPETGIQYEPARSSRGQHTPARYSTVALSHDEFVEPRFRAVTFDLLTALLDSWSLWGEVAGDGERGSRWREAQLRLVASSGAYRPFEKIVAEAAQEVGINEGCVNQLLDRWSQLRPHSDVASVLSRLRQADLKLLVLTNCSQRLAQIAAANVPVRWDAVISAEQAGFYKPHPSAYEAGCRAAGERPTRSCSCPALPPTWLARRKLDTARTG